MTTIDPRSSPLPACKPSGWKWLKALPKHWEARKLKHCLGVNESTLPETTDPDLEFRYIEIGAVNSGDLVEPPAIIRFSAAPSRARRIVKGGDTIVSTVRTYLKAVWYAEDPGDNLICSTGFAVLTPKQGTVPKFASYVAQSALFTDQMTAESVGIAYPAIGEKKLGDLRIGLPPTDEQAAIVRYLDDADQQIQRYIAGKERLIALLEEERQALVHQAVTRGLDPSVRLKPSGVEWLGDVPEHWEIRRAKYLYREADEHSETGTEQLMSVSHKTGVNPRKENVTMFLAESNIGHKLCRPGDIVINTMWAFMAALGVARQEGLVSPSYGVYRPHGESHLDHDYMDSLIRTEAYRMNYLVRSTGITSSRLRLYPEFFLGIPLVYPPKVEQDAIAEHIDEVTTSVDDAITRTRSQIDLMNEYRTRLIADVVTGKIDVREAAERLPELKYEDRTAEQQTLSLTQRST